MDGRAGTSRGGTRTERGENTVCWSSSLSTSPPTPPSPPSLSGDGNRGPSAIPGPAPTPLPALLASATSHRVHAPSPRSQPLVSAVDPRADTISGRPLASLINAPSHKTSPSLRRSAQRPLYTHCPSKHVLGHSTSTSLRPTSPSPKGLHTPTAHPLGRRHRPAADLRRCAMSLGQMPDMRMTRPGPSMDPDIPIRRPIPPGGAPPKHCCAPKSRACLHSPQSTTTAAPRPVATCLQSYQPCQITARLRPT